MDGLGFGSPAHYYQGARAVGVAASAGVVRQSEAVDGTNIIQHALTMSLDYNGMAPTYVYPATSQDVDAATTNTGTFPEGSLVMLPSNYTVSSTANPNLVKVYNTNNFLISAN